MASAVAKYIQDPQARLDYDLNWAPWLSGDTITEVTAEATPTGLTVELPTHTATVTKVWISGGVAGQVYDVAVHIVTAAGREDDRTIQIKIRER